MNKPLLLLIESSTNNCSVALSSGEEIIAVKEQSGKNIHSQNLTLFIEQIMNENQLDFSALHGVVVGKGPGSYTGLRIGMMAAKGICYGAELPLMAVNTLKAMASGYRDMNKPEGDQLLCPMIDARRMEVYCAVFNQEFKTIAPTKAEIISEESFDFMLRHNPLHFFGEGIEKIRHIIENKKNAHFAGEFLPSATFLAKPGTEEYDQENFRDLANYEPYYLKDFVPQHSEFKIRKVLGGK